MNTIAIDIFTTLHHLDHWKDREDDKLAGTVEYREMLQNFLKDNDIKTVCDIGVGEFSFMSAIDWTDIDYIGLDCVNEKIDENISRYKSPHINFYQNDIIEFPETLIPADLYLLKHTIQHWPTETIVVTLPKLLEKCKYLIITNNVCQQNDEEDTLLGGFRGLNPTMYPLNIYESTLVSESDTYSYDRQIQSILIKGNLTENISMYVSPLELST